MTAEEYIIKKLGEQEELNTELVAQNIELQQKNHRLECIVDTLKSHAQLEKGEVWIHIAGYSNTKDMDFIVKALDLKEEEKPNE